MKRYIVKLSEEEKKELHALTHKGTCGVRKLRRAQMLLLANEGLTDEEIARALDGSVSTVERVRKRFVEEGLEAALSEETQARCATQARRASRSLPAGPGLKRSSRRQKALEEYAAVGRQTCGACEIVEEISDETVRRTLKKGM